MKVPFTGGPKRPKLKTPDDRMTLMEHLGGAPRSRIVRCAARRRARDRPDPGACTTACSTSFSSRMQGPGAASAGSGSAAPARRCQLYSLGPLEGLTTRLSVSTYGGIILALPVLMWQMWRFVVPALHAKEKKFAIPFVFSSGARCSSSVRPGRLFDAGEVAGVPDRWSGEASTPTFRGGEYVRLVGLMVAAFGMAFEFPVLLVFLQIVGVRAAADADEANGATRSRSSSCRRGDHAAGDPYRMLALAIPMSSSTCSPCSSAT